MRGRGRRLASEEVAVAPPPVAMTKSFDENDSDGSDDVTVVSFGSDGRPTISVGAGADVQIHVVSQSGLASVRVPSEKPGGRPEQPEAEPKSKESSSGRGIAETIAMAAGRNDWPTAQSLTHREWMRMPRPTPEDYAIELLKAKCTKPETVFWNCTIIMVESAARQEIDKTKVMRLYEESKLKEEQLRDSWRRLQVCAHGNFYWWSNRWASGRSCGNCEQVHFYCSVKCPSEATLMKIEKAGLRKVVNSDVAEWTYAGE